MLPNGLPGGYNVVSHIGLFKLPLASTSPQVTFCKCCCWASPRRQHVCIWGCIKADDNASYPTLARKQMTQNVRKTLSSCIPHWRHPTSVTKPCASMLADNSNNIGLLHAGKRGCSSWGLHAWGFDSGNIAWTHDSTWINLILFPTGVLQLWSSRFVRTIEDVLPHDLAITFLDLFRSIK